MRKFAFFPIMLLEIIAYAIVKLGIFYYSELLYSQTIYCVVSFSDPEIKFLFSP